jgi:guanylate kinase
MVESGRHKKPLLILISAPSGAGKTTLCNRLLADFDDVVYSISCTTRPRRGNEEDGKDYYFLTEEQFETYVQEGRFLEHALVHGHRYGTLRETVTKALGNGLSTLLDIDVQGARQIRKNVSGDRYLAGTLVDIFVTVEDVGILRQRLMKRGEDSAGSVDLRLRNALKELGSKSEFSYVVVNHDLDQAYENLLVILRGNWHGTD